MAGDAAKLLEILANASTPKVRAALISAPELSETLRRQLSACEARWPTLKVSVEVFLKYAAERLPEDGVVETVRHLNAADLYLACACARGVPGALIALDREYLSKLGIVLSRSLGAQQVMIDEVQQVLREKLLLAKDGRPARILSYSGQGSLAAWLKSAALRTAMNLRPTAQATSLDEIVFTAQSPDENAELRLLKSRCQKEFKRAFEYALANSPSEDLQWLRHNLIDGFSIDRLAVMYKVSRATAARRLASARKGLMERTKLRLASELKLGTHDLRSIVGLVRSQLDLSLYSRLRGDG